MTTPTDPTLVPTSLDRDPADARLRLDAALRAGGIATWVMDVASLRVFGDENLTRFFNVDPADADGGPLDRYVAAMHPDDRPRVEHLIGAALESGESYSAEYRVNSADGERWVLARGRIHRDAQGRPTRMYGAVLDVSDRRRAEAAERESEERYRGLFTSINDGFCVIEVLFDDADRAVDYRFLEMNPAFEKHTGLSDAGGRRMKELVPDLEQRWVDLYARVALTGEPASAEDRAAAMGRWFDVRAVRVGGADSRRVAVLFKDTTAAKLAERALRDSEARLRETTEAIAQIIWTSRPNGDIDYYNKRWYDFTGLEDNGTIGDASWTAVPHPEDLPRVQEVWGRAVRTGEDFEMEFRLRGKDGGYRWQLSQARPIRNDAGQIVRWIGSNTDIHDRKVAEAALQQSESRLSDVLQTALDCIIGMDADGRVIDWNPAAEHTFGWTRDEVVGREMAELIIPPQYRHLHRDGLAKYLKTGDGPVFGKRLELTALRRDGSEFPVELTIAPTTAGDPPTFTGFLRDITDRARAERTLRDSEQRFRDMADNVPVMIWVTRPDGYCEYLNKQWYDFTGQSAGEAEGFGWLSATHPDDAAKAEHAFREANARQGEFKVEYRLLRRDGVYRTCIDTASPRFDAEGNFLGYVGSVADITEQAEAEREREALLEAERAARTEAERASNMKDEFLATLSHELRTPLNAILGWSQILRNSGGDADDVAEAVDVIERNARAQTQIIEDLLDMSRIISGKIRLDVQEVDLERVVRAAIETVTPAAEAKSIRIQAVLDPLAHPVSGDPNRLQQVFWNLLSNAVKFSPKGGRVQVLLKRINSHLEVEIIDTGEGIEPQFLPYVFDRFRQADASTTRNHGGLGLGLAIVKQLVELHGGAVRARSGGKGTGTTFTVLLPVTVLHPDPTPDPVRRHPRGDGATVDPDACAQLKGLRVLVVDDEPDARSLVRRLLRDCDAVPTVAGSAAEALQRLGEGSFDVLLSDIGMPGEDGFSLMKKIRALPAESGGDVPAIALTAYARAEDRVRVLRAGYQMHLAKPVEPAELITVVASLAARAPRRG